MPVQPKLRRVVAPPGPTPSNILPSSPDAKSTVRKAVRSHLARADPISCARDPPAPPGKMQVITIHPSQPLVAYYLEESDPDYPEIPVKLIQVQNVQTRNVLWTCYLSDLANMFFNFDPTARDSVTSFPQAIKMLGQIQSMQFFDPSTLYFSGMADPSDSSTYGQVQRWQALLVQFDRRIVMLNLRKGPTSVAVLPPGKGHAARNYYSPILCHLTQDTGLNSNPSSNALPLTRSLLLLGCGDGTFKCWDWKKSKLQKSIKGLGKNDWIVHLISANRYPSLENDSSDSLASQSDQKRVRRFITVTKKCTAYLIEVVVNQDSIDIKPPLARFEGGSAPTSLTPSDEGFAWEHQFLKFDPDRDIFMWTHCPSVRNKLQKVFCWDLDQLKDNLHDQNGGKTVYKPEPTLVIQFPFEQQVAIYPAWSHPAFPDDAIICAVVTQTGELHIMGATNAGTSGTATVYASAITSTNLGAVVQRDSQMVTGPILRVHYLGCAPLWDSGVILVGGTFGVVMVDYESQFIVPGSRHLHFGAGLGSLGKSVLFVKHSSVVYGSIDVFKANPLGKLEAKNRMDVYESPLPTHLPAEMQKRPFRMPPNFLPSPSGLYFCLFWNEEMRYEVLHVPSVLQRVNRSTEKASFSALVAKGEGVSSFAWIGENDTFAVIHSPEADTLGQMSDIDAPTPTIGESIDFVGKTGEKLKNLTDIRNLGNLGHNLKDLQNVKDLAVNTTKGAAGLVVGTTKFVGGAAIGTTKATIGVTTTAAKVGFNSAKVVTGATVKTTKNVVGTTAAVTAKSAVVVGGVAATAVKTGARLATFGLLGGRRRNQERETSGGMAEDGLTEEDDDFVSDPMSQPSMPLELDPAVEDGDQRVETEKKRAFVEFKELNAVETSDNTVGASIAAATTATLGELTLRGGNRIPPRVLFGGPVLCVGCREDENDEGLAYFYTRRKNATGKEASEYVSSGSAMPYPDLVAWDDDGRLCAVVLQSRVAVYLSEEPEFVLLGTVRVGSPADPDGAAMSVKFIHGVLYCCTRTSIECVFLGDMQGGICHLDSHIIASTDVQTLPGRNLVGSYSSLTPPTLPMPLNHPVVLGYQNGSLIVSTVRGLQAIPLSHPLLRVGSLLACGQVNRAVDWFDAVPEFDHEGLASFLERRGHPELAVDLPGLSIETIIDICMRHGYTARLEEVVETFGVKGLRAIDMGRGITSSIFGPEEYGHSVVVGVGAYLLAHGSVELVRRLASECLRSGNDAKKEAFVLAGLLLKVDRADAQRLIGRSVQTTNSSDDWIIGNFVRDHLIGDHAKQKNQHI